MKNFLTRNAAGSIVGHLVSAINGAAIARKTSFLKDKLGERIFASGIRSELEPDQAVHLLAPGRHHDHRDMPCPGISLDPTTDFGPRQVGQHQVEQHQIGTRARDLRESFLAGGRHLRIVACLAQVEAEQIHDVLFILDDEDPRHGPPP